MKYLITSEIDETSNFEVEYEDHTISDSSPRKRKNESEIKEVDFKK